MPGCRVETERRGSVERAAEDEEFSGGVKMGKGELFMPQPTTATCLVGRQADRPMPALCG
jgi:hypothetical protein